MVISGAGFGLALSGELSRRKRHLEKLLQMTILLKGEIRYGNTSLYDAFTGAAGKLDGKYREFFLNTAEMMQTRKGENFGDLFRSCAEKTFGTAGLTPEEREKLYSLGEPSGISGNGHAAETVGNAGKGAGIFTWRAAKRTAGKKETLQKPGNASGNLSGSSCSMITVEGNSWRSVLFLKLQL